MKKKPISFLSLYGIKLRKTAPNISKGRQVAVEGRLQIRSYDGNDGQRRWVTEVIADNVEFLSNSQGQNGGGGQAPRAQSQSNGGFDNSFGGLGEEIVFDDNEIPF